MSEKKKNNKYTHKYPPCIINNKHLLGRWVLANVSSSSIGSLKKKKKKGSSIGAPLGLKVKQLPSQP